MKKLLCLLMSLLCLLLCGCEAVKTDAVNADALPGQFEGQWSMTHLTDANAAGSETDAAFYLSLVITGTDAIAVIVDESELPRTIEMSGTFKNGTLTLTEILPDSEPTVWTVQLLKDGNMRLQYDSVSIFLTPIMPLMMAE